MFQISTDEPIWTADQAATLRQFFNTPTGQLFLRTVFYRRPTVSPLPSGPAATIDPARRAAESEQLAGYERAFQELLSLTIPPK